MAGKNIVVRDAGKKPQLFDISKKLQALYSIRAIFRWRFRVSENLPVPIKNNNNNIHGYRKRGFLICTLAVMRADTYRRRIFPPW